MHTHPTPADIRYHLRVALMQACQEWEAQTGQTFPYVAASRALDAGVSNAIAEHEAMKARLHNTRAAA